MMRTRGWIFSLLVLLPLIVTFILVAPAQGSEEQDDFVIVGADAVAERAIDAFTSPVALDPRFIYEGADAVNINSVRAVPPALPQALDPRYILEQADRMIIHPLQAIPELMPTQLEPRFICEAADATHQLHMAYPCGLVGEPDNPVMSDLQVIDIHANQVTITWVTDEYTDGLVEYGLASDIYLWSTFDATHTGFHSFILTGLSGSTTYYFQVSNTDRCGNTVTSTEHSFRTTGDRLCLPLILK